MAGLDKNDLISLVQTNINDNINQEITPAKVREVDEQIITASANLEELTLQTFKGPITFEDDITFPGQGSVGYTSVGTFISLVTQAGVSDVPATVTFGAGGNTSGNHVTVAANGEITVNTGSYFSIKQRFRAGRVGASGVSELFFWAEISEDNGVTWAVIGNSVDIPLDNSSATVVFFDISNMFFPAGVMLRNRFARSSTGDNSGDLIPASPSATLTGLGVPDAASAQVTIYRIEQ